MVKIGKFMSGSGGHMEWLEGLKRTVLTRNIRFTEREMVDHGIIEVVNCESSIDSPEGIDERMRYVAGLGRSGFNGRVVLVETSVKTYRNGGITRVYSGIVFQSQWMMHLFVVKNSNLFNNWERVPALVN